MFLAGQPASWLAPKPYLQGLGANRLHDSVNVDVLFVNGFSRSRIVRVRLWEYAMDEPVIVKIKNPRLAPGVHEKVTLHGVS